MTRQRQYDPTERIGLNAVERIALEQLKWIYRERPILDFGIDAEIEEVRNGQPTGKLTAIQIKTGASYFRGQDPVHFYVDEEHLKYWEHYSLPVIVVLHNPDIGLTIWQWAGLRYARKTEKGWCLDIPRSQILNASAEPLLVDHDWSDEPISRRRRFLLDRSLMREFEEHEAFIAINVWINKSWAIREIAIRFDDDQKEEPDYVISVVVTWGYGVPDVMEHFFPWLEYEYPDEPEEIGGEIEEHRLSVRLTDVAKGFLLAEDYFEIGLQKEASFLDFP